MTTKEHTTPNNNRLKKELNQVNSMAPPSSKPKLLHLVQEPWIHKTEALKIAKANQARIQPKTSVGLDSCPIGHARAHIIIYSVMMIQY